MKLSLYKAKSRIAAYTLLAFTAQSFAPAASWAWDLQSQTAELLQTINSQNNPQSQVDQKNEANQLVQSQQLPVISTNQQAVSNLIQKGFFTQENYTQFVNSLSFETVYEKISRDSFLSLLIQSGYIVNDINSVSQLKGVLKNKGIDIDALELRPDGILQALVNPIGAPLLKQGNSDYLAAVKLRDSISKQFERNKPAFLDSLSFDDFLDVLGVSDSEAISSDPLFALTKHIDNTTVNSRDYDYVVKAYSVAEAWPFTIKSQETALAYITDPVEITRAVNETNKMPEGSRVLYIGGGLIYSIYDENGNWMPTQFDYLKDANGQVMRDSHGDPIYGPWMDQWQRQVKERINAFMSAFYAAGGRADYIMLDYEEKGSSNYELNAENYEQDLANPTVKVRKDDPSIWLSIMKDARWPALRQAMGITDQDILSNLDKNGNLKGTQKVFNPISQIWNIYHERERNRNFYEAIVAISLKYFPNIKVGSFEDGFRLDIQPVQGNSYRFTNMWGGLGGLDAGYKGLLPSENLTGSSKIAYASGASESDDSDFGQLLGLTMTARANAKASDMQSLHWVKGPDFYTNKTWKTYEGNSSVLPYYAEMIFHLALNGADQIYVQTSDWSTAAGHDYVESLFAELNDPNLIPYSDRKPIVLDTLSLEDHLLVSGVSVNGREIYRVSWEQGSLRSVLLNDGKNGQPVKFRTGGQEVTIPGGRIHIPHGGEVKILSEDGTLSNKTTTGVWVIVDDPKANHFLKQDKQTLLEDLAKPIIPVEVNAYADELHSKLPSGYNVAASKASNIPGKYLIRVTPSGSLNAGDLESLYFSVIANSKGGVDVVAGTLNARYKGVAKDYLDIQKISLALNDLPYGKEEPVVLMAKLKMEAPSFDEKNQLYINFALNGELWRIYTKNNVLRIGKRLADNIRDYRNKLRWQMGRNFTVEATPVQNRLNEYTIAITPVNPGAIATGAFTSLNYVVKTDTDGKLNIDESQLKASYKDIAKNLNLDILEKGLASFHSNNIVMLLSQVRLKRVNADSSIDFSLYGGDWKVFKATNGKVFTVPDYLISGSNGYKVPQAAQSNVDILSSNDQQTATSPLTLTQFLDPLRIRSLDKSILN